MAFAIDKRDQLSLVNSTIRAITSKIELLELISSSYHSNNHRIQPGGGVTDGTAMETSRVHSKAVWLSLAVDCFWSLPREMPPMLGRVASNQPQSTGKQGRGPNATPQAVVRTVWLAFPWLKCVIEIQLSESESDDD
jgi:hypothetical protein